MHKKIWIAAVAGVFTLSACGDTVLEQGLLGAGAGAGTAMVLGGDTTTSAVVGAGVNIYCQNNPGKCPDL